MANRNYGVAILALLLAVQLHAVAYDLRHITIRDGLSNSSVFSILRTKDGKVYFGTCDGLNVYDGVRAWKYEGFGGQRITGNIIVAMADGAGKTLWVQTDHGLTRWEHESGKTTFYPQFQGVRKVRTNPDGDVFLLTDNTLHYSHPGSREIGSCRLAGVSLKDTKDYAVTDKYLFIFKSDKTLRYSIRKTSNGYAVAAPIQIDSTPITKASADGDTEFIVTTDGMLQRYDLSSGEKRDVCSIREEISRRGLTSQIIDYYGTVFVAFQTSGVICISDSIRSLPIQAGVMSLCKDLKSHIVWMGTDGQGVIMYNEPLVSTRSMTFNDLWIDSEKPVRGLYLDKEGTLWMGTKGNGIITFPSFDENALPRQMPRQILQKVNSGLGSDIVYAFSESRLPLFWIGTEAGLDYYSYETRDIRRVSSDEPIKYVVSILEQGDSLWIVTLGNGIYLAHVDGTSRHPRLADIRHYTFDGGKQSSNYFFGMTHDDKGHVWFANRGKGVLTLSQGKLVPVPHGKGHATQSMNDVFAVLWVNGDLWVGTGDGIRILHKDGKETLLTTSDGLPNNTIHALVKGQENNVFASTNNGIVCFLHGDIHSPVVYANQSVAEYSDGAAAYSHHKVLFGGTNGISLLHYSEHIPRTEVDPQIVFTGLSILGREENIFSHLDMRGKHPTLHLDYTQSTFSIALASLNYSEEPDIEYSYRLSPRDRWIHNGIKKEIGFPRMPAGNYTLHVKYKNRLTGKESPEFLLDIHITPPWYWSWWSKLLYLLIILSFIASLAKHAWMRQQHRHQVELFHRDQQQREEMYEEKMNFLTNVVHELNTPLTLINGPCERILGHDGADDFVRKYVGQIVKNLNRIHYLIQEIIDFRRVTTGHHAITIRRVDVSSIMHDIGTAFQETADRNDITMHQAITDGIVWNTDERAWIRIVSNLVSNAFKYTKNGGTINISLGEADGNLRLTVYNTGKGIAPEDRERIFNYYSVFEQADESSTRGLTSRNGLGMAICHKMVMKLGGSIAIDSKEGEYAEFVVTLPPKELPEGASDEIVTQGNLSGLNVATEYIPSSVSVTRRQEKTGEGNRATILAIDDNQDILDMLQEILDDYHVITALNAEEGLEQIKKGIPDLIITDLMMPGIDGLDFVETVKQNKHTMHVPLIILSAKGAEDERVEGLNSGADAYISKPFSISYLEATIKRLLESRSLLREYYNSSASAYTFGSGKLIKSEDQKFITEITRHVDDNLSDPDFSPDNLAALMSLSSRSLYRRLSEVGLPSPKEFIRNHRIDAAAKKLSTTDMNVQEIIYACGFGTRTQFYTDFRKRFGMTPTDYREKMRTRDESL